MPNAGQAAVLVGAPGITRKSDDYFAGVVANTVLGGGYMGTVPVEWKVNN